MTQSLSSPLAQSQGPQSWLWSSGFRMPPAPPAPPPQADGLVGPPGGCACIPLSPPNLGGQLALSPLMDRGLQGPCRVTQLQVAERGLGGGASSPLGSRVGPGAKALGARLRALSAWGNAASYGEPLSTSWPSPAAHLGSLCIWGPWVSLAEPEEERELLVPGAHAASCRGLRGVAEAAAHCLLKGSREWGTGGGQEGEIVSGRT